MKPNVWINIDLLCVLTEVVRASRGRAYCIMMGPGDVSGAEITRELSAETRAQVLTSRAADCWPTTNPCPLSSEMRLMSSFLAPCWSGKPMSRFLLELQDLSTASIYHFWTSAIEAFSAVRGRSEKLSRLYKSNELWNEKHKLFVWKWIVRKVCSIESCHVRNLIIKLTTCLCLMTLDTTLTAAIRKWTPLSSAANSHSVTVLEICTLQCNEVYHQALLHWHPRVLQNVLLCTFAMTE